VGFGVFEGLGVDSRSLPECEDGEHCFSLLPDCPSLMVMCGWSRVILRFWLRQNDGER
jgi:hypothetical protein